MQKNIVDCVNYGSLTLENGDALLGGIMGSYQLESSGSFTCIGCLNLGEVAAKEETKGQISGIMSANTGVNTDSCMNMGLLTTFSTEASLIYFLSGKETISYCLDISKKRYCVIQ